jgi:Chlorophyll A-B binding protein
VKHGRISMLAILGHLMTTAGNRLPGDIAYGVPFSSIKSGLAAFDSIPAAGSLQLVSDTLSPHSFSVSPRSVFTSLSPHFLSFPISFSFSLYLFSRTLFLSLFPSRSTSSI